MFSMLGAGAVSAVAAAIIYANLPTRLTIGGVLPTVDYLAKSNLKLIEKGKGDAAIFEGKNVLAEEIFNANPTLVMAVRRPGCSFCRKEASQICSLSKQLEEKGVKVIGVVHETMGVEDFRPFLGCSDALYFDPEKKFFGPEQRWLPFWMGFLRINTYINTYKTKKAGFVGNLEGEGRLLGGIYLINKDKMLFAHLEKEWGDEPETQQLLDALNDI
ncbi:unnamed protein product [Meloidogyne enterolobii]|uniref:Uncharacterized protein n=1 Tax=Meloidogyne enterolobii TaxID=390850 RepID=A0ACB0XU61_MELEN